jgi:hypothetical protein
MVTWFAYNSAGLLLVAISDHVSCHGYCAREYYDALANAEAVRTPGSRCRGWLRWLLRLAEETKTLEPLAHTCLARGCVCIVCRHIFCAHVAVSIILHNPCSRCVRTAGRLAASGTET